MRGAPSEALEACLDPGLIPAHAGSTAVDSSNDVLDGAHPRACGEHFHSQVKIGAKTGSSPRMRGAPLGCPGAGGVAGLIPAHAGSTLPDKVIYLSQR